MSRVGVRVGAVLGVSHIGARRAPGTGAPATTSVPHVAHLSAGARAPRLSLKPLAPVTGYVDGGWWPRSRDLATEAAALAPALTSWLGPVRQVAYPLDAWEPALRFIEIPGEVEGRWVMLMGFSSQDHHVVLVTSASERTLSLLVVPLEAGRQAGHDAMDRAARPGDVGTPAGLLTASGAGPGPLFMGPRRPSNSLWHRAGPG